MKRWLSLLLLINMAPAFVLAQYSYVVDSSEANHRKVIPGREYAAGGLKNFLFGKNWRKEWLTAVRVPVLHADTILGGLVPVELGGGRQTKTLHVKDAAGKRYVLRSVNKTYTLALPEIARGTFIETIMNDQIATIHPFAALAIPPMAKAAGVYHTEPRLYFLPENNHLGKFQSEFGNMLVLLEERPDETHAGEKKFGAPDDIDGSETMIENITEDNDVTMDQHQYLKTRLFDMFIGDWGRHIDNWRWAEFDSGKKTTYKPVPKDRDQTWAKFQGLLIKLGTAVAGVNQLQTFGDKIKSVEWFNAPALEIDRRFTNALNRKEWIDSAKAIQQYLTDAVIEKGVREIPPETFALSGQEIIEALKQRRNDLIEYADQYYSILSRNVDIPGSDKHEYFEINRIDDDTTEIKIFKRTKDGTIEGRPLYSRKFLTSETDEVRIYALDGDDVFLVNGKVNKGITIRIIGGPGNDQFTDASMVSGGTHKTKFYDSKKSYIESTSESKLRIADTTYKYPFDENFHFNHSGFSLAPGLNTYYRLYVGASWKNKKYGWREQPYKSLFRMGINYSLSENSFHPYIMAEYPQLFGAWNFNYALGYDGSRRFHYFGIGNNTPRESDINSYYFLRTENFYASTKLEKPFKKYHAFVLALSYDGVRVLHANNTFISKPISGVPNETYNWNHFGTAEISYSYNKLNDILVPTKGLNFSTGVEFANNFTRNNSFNRYKGNLEWYQPLAGKFSLFINTGAATLTGHPMFYQLNNIGGNVTLRGYLRNRFYGKTVFYEQNELRWIPDVRSYLFNGKMGIIGVYDIGRVWQPGETSDTWHYGYGGGIMIAPFNKISATVYYTISPEDKVFNVRIGKFF